MFTRYTDAFQGQGDGTTYDSALFARGSYGELLSIMELDFVRHQAAALKARGRVDYLDFACGTGRILSQIEAEVDNATGYDIAEPMIDIARSRVTAAKLVRIDLATDRAAPAEFYDLITAFRFFLHAESALRDAIMAQLVARLKSPDSRLVFNVHSMPASYKRLDWMVKKLSRRQNVPHFMSHAEAVALCRRHGLEIVEDVGYGFVSGKAIDLFGFGRTLGLERRLAAIAWLKPVGSHRLYAARLRQG